ncbi:hypothetical protein [Bacillus haynesii]|uniref:hypothetical protein n=1 Tax=Bacillus haynesii TaxID=1925021 RepID=UPI0022829C35|nr:hypothetical protein [Bacillus haynesii]MCY9156266.1 hypothetical protein [Bacillus haynesii]MCY9450351.1 hypothetical protein [Bacillus haynesii]MEC0685069.1 hypothetical protein [Bacillus haynesii]
MKPKLIGLGTKRKVYDMGDGTVIKVQNKDFGFSGVYSNIQEISLFNEFVKRKTIERPLFNLGEIIDHHPSGYWLRMKKYSQERIELMDDYLSQVLDVIPMMDANAANIGVTEDSHMVLLDYEGIDCNCFFKSTNPYVAGVL